MRVLSRVIRPVERAGLTFQAWQVTVKTLDVLRTVYDELKDKSSMVTPLQIGSQLVDWTDPQKVM